MVPRNINAIKMKVQDNVRIQSRNNVSDHFLPAVDGLLDTVLRDSGVQLQVRVTDCVRQGKGARKTFLKRNICLLEGCLSS